MYFISGTCQCHYGNTSLRSSDRRRGQRCCGRIYGKELMTALAVALVKFQEGKPFFVNCYPRVVTQDGSREAQLLVDEMMEACDCEWRGLGVIPKSGMKLRQEWQEFDARLKYQMPKIEGNQIRPAAVAMYFRENANHPIVKYSEKAVHRSIRSAPAWCPVREPALHIISIHKKEGKTSWK